jgi:hypothetical protein
MVGRNFMVHFAISLITTLNDIEALLCNEGKD